MDKPVSTHFFMMSNNSWKQLLSNIVVKYFIYYMNLASTEASKSKNVKKKVFF